MDIAGVIRDWLGGVSEEQQRRQWGRPSRALQRRYTALRHICQGGSGNVWLCQDKGTAERVACKVVETASMEDPRGLESLRTEILIMKQLTGRGHANVLKLLEVHEGNSKTELVLEYCPGGDLFDLIRKRGALPVPQAKGIFVQVAKALALCHANNIVHRDIKADNVLLMSYPGPRDIPEVKLADFGLSDVLPESGFLTEPAGSSFWAAPEILSGSRHGTKVDVWSLGVVLFCMLTGKLPRDPEEESSGLWRSFLEGRVNFGLVARWRYAPSEARDLVRRMLEPRVEDRLDIFEVLAHPWVAKEAGVPEQELDRVGTKQGDS